MKEILNMTVMGLLWMIAAIVATGVVFCAIAVHHGYNGCEEGDYD